MPEGDALAYQKAYQKKVIENENLRELAKQKIHEMEIYIAISCFYVFVVLFKK